MNLFLIRLFKFHIKFKLVNTSIKKWKNWDHFKDSSINFNHPTLYKEMCLKMVNRQSEFINITHSWRQSDDELNKL